MQGFCNSRHVTNLLVMVLRLNKLAETIVGLHTRLLKPSTNFRLLLHCILCPSCVVHNAREDPFPLP